MLIRQKPFCTKFLNRKILISDLTPDDQFKPVKCIMRIIHYALHFDAALSEIRKREKNDQKRCRASQYSKKPAKKTAKKFQQQIQSEFHRRFING